MKDLKDLIVVRKPLRYPRGFQHRMMMPGEVFQARNSRDERVLLFSKRVELARVQAEVPAPPAHLLAKLSPPDQKISDNFEEVVREVAGELIEEVSGSGNPEEAAEIEQFESTRLEPETEEEASGKLDL